MKLTEILSNPLLSDQQRAFLDAGFTSEDRFSIDRNGHIVAPNCDFVISSMNPHTDVREMPVQFSQLRSFSVDGDAQLQSLKGCPQTVRYFVIISKKIKTIDHFPSVITHLTLKYSSISSLSGIHKVVKSMETVNVKVNTTHLLGLFLIVYSFGSDHFSSLFTGYYLDLDAWQAFVLTALGFFISFTFWNYWIPEVCYEKNDLLDNDFKEEAKTQNQNSFSFLDIDFERRSGEITLFLLNALLLVFIATYNYEQFFEVVKKSNLSSDTHERVTAVILSIIMAVGVILFYFKGGFNFDEKAKNLKKLAKIWILLNGILILSAIIKNSEYVSFFGLTYKRLGVYVFLILAIIGLVISFIKITKQKTNAFLFNQMIWYFYGTILLCSFVNWGNLITNYNISVNKGVEQRFLRSLNFNDKAYYDYFKLHPEEVEDKYYYKEGYVKRVQNETILSRSLYFEFLETNK